MRNQILTVLFAVAVTGVAVADAPPSMQDLIQQDYTRLSGTFRMTSGVIDGKEVRRQTVLVTDRDKFTVSDRGTAGTSAEGVFTIDPAKSPKTADSVQGTGPDRVKRCLEYTRSSMITTSGRAGLQLVNRDRHRSHPNRGAATSFRFGRGSK